MAWFYRAIEQPDGRWACRHGLTVYDTHPNLTDAIQHLRKLASPHGEHVIYAHPLDGDPWPA